MAPAEGHTTAAPLTQAIDGFATTIVDRQAEELLTQVVVTLGNQMQHLEQNRPLEELADAIQSEADLRLLIDSGLADKLQELGDVIESQKPQEFTYEGIDELAEIVHANGVEQDLAQLLPPMTQALQVLQKELDYAMKRTVVEQASDAVFQWHGEQRLVTAMAEGDPTQVLESLQQLSKENLRPQVEELAEALQGWHEQQLIAEVAAEFSGVMDRLRGPSHGMEQLAEAITKQQAMEQVAEVITNVGGRIGQWEQYPQMGELAELIQQQQQIDVLLEGSLTDKLNEVGHSLEEMLEQPPSLAGVQELAKAIHETQQQDAVAEHMQALGGMSKHVEQWMEQQEDVQQLSQFVQTLRSDPEESIAELRALTEQMQEMGIDVTPKPQRQGKVVVEKPELRKDKVQKPVPNKPVEKPVRRKPEEKRREDRQLPPQPHQKIEEQLDKAPVWTEERLKAIEFLRPENIEAHSWRELIVESAISPQIATKYFESMDGDRAREFLLSHALGQVTGHGQQYATDDVKKFLRRYEHLDAGGMWCRGVPVDGEMWGQFKPNDPIKTSKDKGRFEVKLKSGEILHLSKPENYKEEFKVLKYESMPKGVKQDPKALKRELDDEFVDEELVDFDAIDNNLLEEEELENKSLQSHFAFCDDLQQLRDDPSIPIWQTEGGKKGASIYTEGEAAIALNGVNGGYQLNEDGSRSLAIHLREYDWEGRTTILAFDKDPIQKIKTQQKVAIALYRYGQILEMEGADVFVAQMPGRDDIKMGVDDFRAQGNKLSDLEIMSYDEWVEQNPYVQAHLERIGLEIEIDQELEDNGMELD